MKRLKSYPEPVDRVPDLTFLLKGRIIMGKGPEGMEKALLKIEELKKSKEAHAAAVKRLTEAGVYFVDADSVILTENTVIGKNTVVYPNVIFEGTVTVGEGNIIYPGCRFLDSQIEDFNEFEGAIITKAKVGNYSTFGPFAYIRPDSVIGDHVKIGDFVEVKNTEVGDGTKVSHLTYLGDAKIGKAVNFGCGTVIVNYNGKEKTVTTVGDHAFIGCNTNLVSPVNVGANAYTAAGTTITEDVPDGAMAIGRVKQVVKLGWVEKKGLKK